MLVPFNREVIRKMQKKYALNSSNWIEYLSCPSKGIIDIVDNEENEIVTSAVAIAELADQFCQQEIDFTCTRHFIENRAKIVILDEEITMKAVKMRRDNPDMELAHAIHVTTASCEKAMLC